MKTLLFVQSGDARPKVAKSFGVRTHAAIKYFARVRERLGREGQPDKAFLVECASAEAGRTIIRGVPGHMHTGNDCNTCSAYQFNGRILASGGRSD